MVTTARATAAGAGVLLIIPIAVVIATAGTAVIGTGIVVITLIIIAGTAVAGTGIVFRPLVFVRIVIIRAAVVTGTAIGKGQNRIAHPHRTDCPLGVISVGRDQRCPAPEEEE